MQRMNWRDHSNETTIFDIYPRTDDAVSAVKHALNQGRTFTCNRQGRSQKGLRLSFARQPRKLRHGFIFGTDANSCDIVMPTGTQARHSFAVTFVPPVGLPVVRDLGCANGLAVGGRRIKQHSSQVIVQGANIQCGNVTFEFRQPDRSGKDLQQYEKHLRAYLGYLLTDAKALLVHVFALPVSPTERIGPFLLIKKLGAGAFGQVTLLAYPDTGQVFAGKRFMPQNRPADIANEVRMLQSVQHENIVKFITYTQDQQSICLIMEYLPDGNLEGKKDLDPPIIIGIIEQCLIGLRHLHDRGIMHRDIKPGNIVLKSSYPIAVKLADFGLATATKFSRQMAGTIVYCAPELMAGGQYDCSVDIWALGLTILELFQKFPVAAGNKFNQQHANPAAQQAWVATVHQVVERFPTKMAAFLRGMLAANPRERWSAATCLAEIEALHKYVQKDHIRHALEIGRVGRAVQATVETARRAFTRINNHRRTF